jgi:hypothetical protein
MLDWLHKKTPAPLRGAPAIRRQKTYSAASGYVYQYYYQGHRRALRASEEGTEYVFEVWADRKTAFEVSVFLRDSAVVPWQQEHQRELISAERHAIAKMALFQAFDEREKPEQMRQEVTVRPADADQILATLGLD